MCPCFGFEDGDKFMVRGMECLCVFFFSVTRDPVVFQRPCFRGSHPILEMVDDFSASLLVSAVLRFKL